MGSEKLVVGSGQWAVAQWVVSRGQWTVVKGTNGQADLPAFSQSGTVMKEKTNDVGTGPVWHKVKQSDILNGLVSERANGCMNADVQQHFLT